MKPLLTAVTLVCVLLLAAPAANAAAPRPVDFELKPGAERAGAASAHGGVVSRKLVTPRRFNLVGLRWRGGAEPDIELRVRTVGARRWSRWQHLNAHADHNPDLWLGESVVAGSDPVWVGRASAIQYRLDRRVAGLRLHFVDMGDSRGHARAAARPRPRRAQGTPFPYVPREDWGADRCPPRTSPSFGSVRSVHVHHTVSLNDYSAAEAPSVVLAICRYHRNSNGWADVGYNMLVDRFGTLYEGREGGLDQPVIGAQAQGFNAQTAGIASIGDHRELPATPATLSSLASYIRWKLTVHGQPLTGSVTLTSAGGSATRYAPGARVRLGRVIGHRDTGLTACPGQALYDQLPELRALVEAGTVPVISTSTRVSATLSDDRVDYGEVVPVGGTLLAPDGTPVAGEDVLLQVSSEGSWRTARRITTGLDGAFLGDLKPAKRMYVRVRYPGRTGLRGSTSSRLLLRLRPALTLERLGGSGGAVRMRGTVAPRKRTVRLVVQRVRANGSLRKVAARTLRARRGRFSTAFVPRRGRSYRIYAVARADLDTDRGASDPLGVGRSAPPLPAPDGGGVPAR